MSEDQVDQNSEQHKAYQATLPRDLESQILDPRIAKNEREWWASSEIRRLRDCLAVHEGDQGIINLRSQLAAMQAAHAITNATVADLKESLQVETERAKLHLDDLNAEIEKRKRAEAGVAATRSMLQRVLAELGCNVDGKIDFPQLGRIGTALVAAKELLAASDAGAKHLAYFEKLQAINDHLTDCGRCLEAGTCPELVRVKCEADEARRAGR